MATTKTETNDELLNRLSRRFKAQEVEKRDGFHYVSIDATINRFNAVLGFNWSLEITNLTGPTPIEGETTSSGKQIYLAAGYGHIRVHLPLGPVEIIRAGSGSSKSFDPDMAVKTTQAEIMKKAGHQFGVGLNLWDENERLLADLPVKRDGKGKFLGLNPDGYKKAVILLSKIAGVEQTADSIAAHFNITPDELADGSAFEGILIENNVI
jgi:hypothetical protein